MFGIPAYKLVQELPNREYIGWLEYFSRRPVGWREDQRAALQISVHAGKKFEPQKYFPSLSVIYKEQEGRAEFEKKRVKQSPFMALMRTVAIKNGDTGWLNFLEEPHGGKSNRDRDLPEPTGTGY